MPSASHSRFDSDNASGPGDVNTGRSGDSNLDEAEVNRFGALASKWWDPLGEFRPLHQLGPARLTFIRDKLQAHFGELVSEPPGTPSGSQQAVATTKVRPGGLAGLRILDVGCGGGLVCEPLCRLGADVTGIDPAVENIEVARAHAADEGLDIAYLATTVEDLANKGRVFDVVVCLEVLEHVPDPPALVATCARLVRPGGMLVASTINRTPKSYALAIVAAEYVLGWVPRGTHNWERFVTPDELGRACEGAGLRAPQLSGIVYDPIRDKWRLSDDVEVNYLAASLKPQT